MWSLYFVSMIMLMIQVKSSMHWVVPPPSSSDHKDLQRNKTLNIRIYSVIKVQDSGWFRWYFILDMFMVDIIHQHPVKQEDPIYTGYSLHQDQWFSNLTLVYIYIYTPTLFLTLAYTSWTSGSFPMVFSGTFRPGSSLFLNRGPGRSFLC